MRKPNDTVVLGKDYRNFQWKYNKFAKWVIKNKIKLIGVKNILNYEQFEQYLVSRWIKPNDVVLEIGARLGVVSSCINRMLSNKTNHVVIEPDTRIYDVLLENRKITKSHFQVCTNVLGNSPLRLVLEDEGLGTRALNDGEVNENTITVPNITVSNFFAKYKLKFNVLVIDCEGCLCKLIEENGDELLENIRFVLFEMDNQELCKYDIVVDKLIELGFKFIDRITFHKNSTDQHFQQVWIR